MENKYTKTIFVVLLMFLVPTIVLVVINWQEPGLCPPYPFIGLPACLVIGFYFILMLISLFISHKRIGDYLFYVPATIGLLSAIMFSTKQIMGLSQCPTLFNIPLPLCYTAVVAFALLLLLKWKGEHK